MESLMRACVVHSKDVDSVDAVAELIAGAQVALGASLPRVAMLFAGIDHDFAVVLEQINAQWPGMELIGCTTDGEMSSHILFAEDSLALVLLAGGVGRCGPDLRRHRWRPVAIHGHQAVPWQGSTPGFCAVPPLRGGRCLFLWCGYRMASHRARGAGHRC